MPRSFTGVRVPLALLGIGLLLCLFEETQGASVETKQGMSHQRMSHYLSLNDEEEEEEEDEEPEVIHETAVTKRVATLDEQHDHMSMEASSWACAPYSASAPWEAHEDLLKYKGGFNDQDLDMTNTVSWPLTKVDDLTNYDEDYLCMYLSQQSHCYPPVPKKKAIVNMDELPFTYFATTFWGDASDERVGIYKDILDGKMDLRSDVDREYIYLSYFPSHIKELRYVQL